MIVALAPLASDPDEGKTARRGHGGPSSGPSSVSGRRPVISSLPVPLASRSARAGSRMLDGPESCDRLSSTLSQMKSVAAGSAAKLAADSSSLIDSDGRQGLASDALAC